MSAPLPPVVITRPRAQAGPLTQRVTELGRTAIVFPLLEIQPLPDPAPLRAALQDLSAYALVVFVSPNAIDAALGGARDLAARHAGRRGRPGQPARAGAARDHG